MNDGDNYSWHNHKLVKNEDGTYGLTSAMGHSHELDNSSLSELIGDMVTKGDIEMSKTAAELQTALDDQKAETQRLEKVLALSAEHREYYDGMESDSNKAAFLEKSADERDALIATAKKRANPDNPVVYTTKAGVDIRESDGPTVLALAKSNDEQLVENQKLAKKLAKSEKERVSQDLRKRAEALKHIPGDLDTRIEMLKAIDGIEDEEARKKANAALVAQNDKLASAFKNMGHLNEPEDGSAQDQLNQLAKARLEKNSDLTPEQAMDAVLKTNEGQKLYTQTLQ